MSGKTSHVSPLHLRKQLLIAESELNRAQLAQEWERLAHGVSHLAHQARGVAAWAAAAAALVAGFKAWRHGSTAAGTAKSSGFQKILHGLRLASTIWLALRARGQKEAPR